MPAQLPALMLVLLVRMLVPALAQGQERERVRVRVRGVVQRQALVDCGALVGGTARQAC